MKIEGVGILLFFSPIPDGRILWLDEIFLSPIWISKLLAVICLTIPNLLFFPFNCYLACPQPTLDNYQWDSPTNPMLITALSSGVWTGNLPILIVSLNPLGHSPLSFSFLLSFTVCIYKHDIFLRTSVPHTSVKISHN